jgi:hypothetical protein
VVTLIEGLIESFATNALGLALGERILDVNELPPAHIVDSRAPAEEPSAWCAWQLRQGVATILAQYHSGQSLRVRADVICFAWWIGDATHHRAFYHCYRKFPADWIKGQGTPNRW